MDNPPNPVDKLLKYAVDQTVLTIVDGIPAQLDLGSFVAGPEPDSDVLKAVQNLMQGSCESYSQGFLNNPVSDLVYDDYCGQYLSDNGVSKLPGSFSPPFTGGQCVTDYTVKVGFTSSFSGTPATTQRSGIQGPIASIEFTEGEPGSGTGNGVSLTVVARSENGETKSWFTLNCVPGSSGGIDISRDDGQPDTCGNPPLSDFQGSQPTGTYPPGWNPPIRQLPTPFGDIPITVTVNPDGSLTVCYEEVCVTANLDNGLVTGGDGQGGAGGRGQPDTAQEISADATNGQAEGEFANSDPSRELTGVLVEMLTFAPKSRLEVGVNPLVFTAGWLGWGTGTSGIEFPSSRIIGRKQFFSAPIGTQSFSYKISVGGIAKLTPFFSE